MLRASIAIVASFASLSGIALAAHGIQTGDMNPKVDACTDFFEYANGALARGEPDPGLHGSLEQALGSPARSTRSM